MTKEILNMLAEEEEATSTEETSVEEPVSEGEESTTDAPVEETTSEGEEPASDESAGDSGEVAEGGEAPAEETPAA